MKRAVKKIMPIWAKSYAQSVRSYARNMILQYRQASWSSRCLPNFIIIGAQRCGSSSMYDYLSQHPQLVPSFPKEVHFFDFDGGLNPSVNNFKKGKPWYCAHFPLQKSLSSNQQAFEATPDYIFYPLAPGRIARFVPEVKLIALLRNPTERAISQYFHEKGEGQEPLAIDEALRKEGKGFEPAVEAQYYKSVASPPNPYKRRGLYKEQLERYLKYFSREQILVMSSEEFFSKPDMSLRRVFEFVGVDPEYKVPNLVPRNVSHNRTDVASSVYDYLDSFFRPHNQDLYDMLEVNYGW